VRKDLVPQRSPDLKALIQEAYPALPANQRKVADFLLRHLTEAPFYSVADVERGSGASKATVVRFARSLGFSGFLEMRSRLLEGVQTLIRVSDPFPLPAREDQRDTLTTVARQDVRNINQTINNLDRALFREVALMFLHAGRVYTAGLGISNLMARILAYSLNQVAVRAAPFTQGPESFLEQLAFLTGADVLVVFSFPPYSRETIDLARLASGKGIPVVAVTDRETSPASLLAAKTLPVQSQNMLFTNSFSAISVVINAIATEVAVRNKSKALRMAKQIDTMLRDTGHYVEE
jgi:DNA-binding MurR/RpiR family transcriptional regulator